MDGADVGSGRRECYGYLLGAMMLIVTAVSLIEYGAAEEKQNVLAVAGKLSINIAHQN